MFPVPKGILKETPLKREFEGRFHVLKHLKTKNPKSIKSCVLLDKPSRRKVELVPDYCGFTIEDKFVVGYGLNYGDYYRNIPYVFAVTDEDRK